MKGLTKRKWLPIDLLQDYLLSDVLGQWLLLRNESHEVLILLEMSLFLTQELADV